MKITDVVTFRVHGRYTGPNFPPGNRQAKALDLYPEFNTEGDTSVKEKPISAIYVEIQTDEGVSGLFGPIEEPNAFTINHSLKPFLIGRDPLATELLSDQMRGINPSTACWVDRPGLLSPRMRRCWAFRRSRKRPPNSPPSTRTKATPPKNGSSATALATGRTA